MPCRPATHGSDARGRWSVGSAVSLVAPRRCRPALRAARSGDGGPGDRQGRPDPRAAPLSRGSQMSPRRRSGTLGSAERSPRRGRSEGQLPPEAAAGPCPMVTCAGTHMSDCTGSSDLPMTVHYLTPQNYFKISLARIL